MATKLLKPVVRELPEQMGGKTWIVEITDAGINLRQKKKQFSYSISWDGVLWKAVANTVEFQKKEKKKAKELKKAGLL